MDPKDLAATVWTTDDHLRLTSLESPLLARVGVPATRLVGHALCDLLTDGDDNHPLLDAHRAALAGRETTFQIEWGRHTFAGWVSPVLTAGGSIIGCSGVGHAAESAMPGVEAILSEGETARARARTALEAWRAATPPSDPRCPALEAGLDDVCEALELEAVIIWARGSDGRLRHVGQAGAYVDREAVIEPYAWLASSGDEPTWSEDAGVSLMPLRVGHQCRGVLGVVPKAPIPPEDDIAQVLAIVASDLARRLPAPTAWVPRDIPEPVLLGGLRVRLAFCLVPLPFLMWAC